LIPKTENRKPKSNHGFHGWPRIKKELWKRFSNLFGVSVNP
jgi:hypothetical protein